VNAAEYRSALDSAIAVLTAIVRSIIVRDGVPVTDEQRFQMATQVLRHVREARIGAYAAARGYLRQVDPLIDTPNTLDDYNLGAPIELIKRVVDDEAVTAATRRDSMAESKAAKAITRGLARHAEQPARELVTAAAEGTERAAWQRVLTGPTSCYFCAMLASRGPVYGTKHDALTGKGTGQSIRDGQLVYVYHDGCDCLVIFVPAGAKNWEGRSEWKRLAHMWKQADDAEDDDRPTRNVFRSYWEAEVRKGNGGKYVAESIIPTPAAA
jgi:hypothetical protein